MKSRNAILLLFGLTVCFMGLTAFKFNPKTHLIEGCWLITEENKIVLTQEKLFINQLFFSGDQLTSKFSFTDRKGKMKDKQLRLAYNTYDFIEEYNKPVVYFISTCDKNFKLAFTIEKLTKDSMELKCIRDVSSKNILPNYDVLTFERIAGPPENISHSEDTIEMEIDIDEKK